MLAIALVLDDLHKAGRATQETWLRDRASLGGRKAVTDEPFFWLHGHPPRGVKWTSSKKYQKMHAKQNVGASFRLRNMVTSGVTPYCPKNYDLLPEFGKTTSPSWLCFCCLIFKSRVFLRCDSEAWPRLTAGRGLGEPDDGHVGQHPEAGVDVVEPDTKQRWRVRELKYIPRCPLLTSLSFAHTAEILPFVRFLCY